MSSSTGNNNRGTTISHTGAPRHKPGAIKLHLAKLERSVDDRIHHRVGEPDERHVVEENRVDDYAEDGAADEEDVVRRPADQERQDDYEGYAQ